MTGQVLTEVSAVVAPDREAGLLAAYRQLVAQPLPDGLVRTELLSGQDGRWRIQTLWRDRAALDAMRADPEAPAAPRLFREAGADPSSPSSMSPSAAWRGPNQTDAPYRRLSPRRLPDATQRSFLC